MQFRFPLVCLESEIKIFFSKGGESNGFPKDSYGKIKSDKGKEHTKRVVELCSRFADLFSDEIDRKLLLDAAWLHDIAKSKHGEMHHDKECIIEILNEYEEAEIADRKDDIAEIISAHKKAFNPSSHELESAILRICDKLDRFKKGKDDAEEKCKGSLKRISKILPTEQYEKLKQFTLEIIEENKL